jgi:hypothetical protein
VNAAFMLVATAWFAGADANNQPEKINPPKTPANVVAPTTVPAPMEGSSCCGGCGSSCDSGCDSCDSCGSGGFFGRLRGMFRRHSSCGCDSGCESNCCTPVSVPVSCGCDSCGDSCCDGGGHGFFSRLRGRFHRSSCCDTCDTCGGSYGGCGGGCGSCGGSYGTYGTYGAGSTIIAPGAGDKDKTKPADKMPDGKGNKNNNKNNEGTSNTPKSINAPALVPNVTVETEKNPF